MHVAEAVKIALHSLWANKLRSLLTLLGVVIGIAAVIAVVTLVDGINGYVATRFFNLGANVFVVLKIPPTTNIDKLLEAEKRKDLTMEEYEAALEACSHCEWLGAEQDKIGRVKYGQHSISNTNVQGLTPSMSPVLDVDLVEGRMVDDIDMRNHAAVVVIGPDIADNLMAGMDPIGREIRVDGRPYRVIGIGKPKGKRLGLSMDNYAIMPITAFQKQNGTHGSVQISGKASTNGIEFQEAMDEVRAILRVRRHVHPGDDDDFDIETNESLMGMWSSISKTFFYAMIGISAISLVVGGIGIMNIMLVAVTERTREIGIRKATGARRTDIMLQFLMESVAVALVGGAAGIVLGISSAKGVTLAIGLPSEIELWAVLAGVLVASCVGVFFGVYPARRAARLDPIAALRSET